MTTVDTPPAVASTSSRLADGWRPVAALAAATALLRVPALLADRHLTVDDGVFGASAAAMRTGALPFRDVFSSQGPLFLPLVWLADTLGLRTMDAPRLVGLASGVALVLATYAAGLRLADRSRAFLAAGLVGVTGSVLWVTAPIAADGPALAFAALAVAVALAYRERPSAGTAIGVGLAMGAALSVKSLVLSAGVPVGLLLLAHRRPRHLVAAIGAAAAVGLAVSLPWGLADVWDQSVAYHLEAASDRTPFANLGKVASTFADRDLPLLAAAVVAVLFSFLRTRRGATPPLGRRNEPRWASDAVVLWSWLGATLLVLALEYPLWRPHVSYLAAPVALLVARARPPWAALAVALLVVLPFHANRLWPVLWPSGYDADAAAVVDAIRDLPEGARGISDQPGLVWRAGRLTPPDLVDASRLRIDSGRITGASLAAAAADPRVCAVAVWSDRFASLDRLPERLAAAGYVAATFDTAPRTLYLKPACTPS